jgi:hypothetical protein
MAVVSGIRGTGILASEQRVIRDVSPVIAQLQPDAAPLTTLLMRLKSKVATAPKFEWYEDDLLPRFDTLASGLGANDTSMSVTNYQYFRKGDIVRINKNEIVLVTATPTTSSVSIKRGLNNNGTGIAAPSGAQLHIIGNANEEGSVTRDILTTQKVLKYNYCQIFRHPFGVTNTADASNLYGGSDMKVERTKHLIEHKKDIELSFLLGYPSEDLSGTQPRRTTGGINYFITTNVYNAEGQLTEMEFNDFLRTIMQYGSSTRIGFISPLVASVINAFATSKLQTRSDEKTYGITLTRYQNAAGIVELHQHKLLVNDSLSDYSGIAGWGIFVDIDDLMLRYMNGRFTILKENIQPNDADSRIDEYLSEVGLQLQLEKKHGLLVNVTM